MADMLGRQAGLDENEPRAAADFVQLEAHDAVDALRHALDAPRLHDALAGPELDVAAADIAAMGRECAAFLGADLRRAIGGEGRLLARIHQRAIDPLRRGLQRDLLTDRRRHHGISAADAEDITRAAGAAG